MFLPFHYSDIMARRNINQVKSRSSWYGILVISQPDLKGLGNDRKPDFMFLRKDSTSWSPVLVEIEDPNKDIYLSDKVKERSEFTEARAQIKQWKSWFDRSENEEIFKKRYIRLHSPRAMDLKIDPQYILIYGRRSEFENDRDVKEHRRTLLDRYDSELMSYDRLYPSMHYGSRLITVQAKGPRQYEAKAVPRTFSTAGAPFAKAYLEVSGLKDAIIEDDRIRPERQDFLLERIDYWREWASSDSVNPEEHSLSGNE
ncbi:hypothetical protein GGP54_003171 [Salinibacter ruber]|uniref:Shedu protein SduA C-terminal domain-containing protein n=1 Tax=Salinibacter ruber TaxID=146919 RepID=A0A9X3A0B5_9BACT|nr:hypothetical protein [Salinibacter ruber]MCS4038068.1 hypothetical protein [Salinibacter ruber]